MKISGRPIRPQIVVLACVLAALPAWASDVEPAPFFELLPGEAPTGPGIEAAWRVAVATEQVAAGAPRLALEMPDGLEFEATLRRVTRRARGEATWVGGLADESGGQVVLSMTGGVLSGWIQSRFGTYELRPLGGGEHLIARVDPDHLPACSDAPAVEMDPGSPIPPGPPATATDGPGRLDVLVLYTPEAQAEAGGVPQIKSRIGLMVEMANEAFANSRMDARLNLVHVTTAGFGDSGDDTDLDNLLASGRAANLRDRHQADLVALIVGSGGEFCGVAFIQRFVGPSFAPFALSVTAFPCLLTFAHEIGHNLGFEHDPANGGSPVVASFPWAFGHFVSNDFRTVMAYPDPCGNCQRILNFSNPRVSFEGHSTGIENQRDNARAGNQTAPVVANFRLSGVLFEDDFEGTGLGSWTTARSGLDLIEPGLGGSGQALAVTLTNTGGLRYLAHKVPSPGLGVDVEFLLNMNGVELGGTELGLLEFLGQGQRHLRLAVWGDGGQYRLTLYAKANTGDYVAIADTPVRREITERIGIVWRAASAPGAADGYVRLLKNGGPRGTVNDFANDARVVREIRLGVPGGSSGTVAGEVFLLDDYAASAPVEQEGE